MFPIVGRFWDQSYNKTEKWHDNWCYCFARYIKGWVVRKYLAGIYLFKASNGNIRKMCGIYSKLTTETPEQRHWRLSGVFFY